VAENRNRARSRRKGASVFFYAQGFTVLRAGDRGSYGDMGKDRNMRTRQKRGRVKGRGVTTWGIS
jgi:hypothetical protein